MTTATITTTCPTCGNAIGRHYESWPEIVQITPAQPDWYAVFCEYGSTGQHYAFRLTLWALTRSIIHDRYPDGERRDETDTTVDGWCAGNRDDDRGQDQLVRLVDNFSAFAHSSELHRYGLLPDGTTAPPPKESPERQEMLAMVARARKEIESNRNPR